MNRQTITRTIFLAGMAISASVFAGPEIVKCIDDQGKVTLTDGQCPGGSDTEAVVIGNTEPALEAAAGDAVVSQASAIQYNYGVRLPVRRALPVVRKQVTGAALARDITTLKAARLSLQMLDSAAQAMRARRVANLN